RPRGGAHPSRRPGAEPGAAAEPGMGIRLRSGLERRGRLHRVPAAEARIGAHRDGARSGVPAAVTSDSDAPSVGSSDRTSQGGIMRDTRSKGLAITALVLGGVGLVLALVGFIPVPVAGLLLALMSGVMLLLAVVLSIVALASKKQGGKGLGIAALVSSTVGVVVAFFAVAYGVILLLAVSLSHPVG